MSDNIQELRSKLEQANKSIESLNSTSDANSANKNLLTQQFKEKCDIFEKKYGIRVTVDNIATIKQQIVAEKEKEYNTVASILQAIQNGEIDKAYQLAGVERTDVDVNAQPVQNSAVASAVQTSVQTTQSVEQSVVSQPKIEQPINTGIQQAQSQPAGVEQPIIQPAVQPSGDVSLQDDKVTIVKPHISVPQEHTKIVVPDDAVSTSADNTVVKSPVTMSGLKQNNVNANEEVEKQDRINNFMASLGKAENSTGSALQGTALGNMINNI